VRIGIKLRHSNSFFSVPLQKINEQVQASIYENLPLDKAVRLHNEGYAYEKRRFKLFTFSRILGKIDRNRRNGELTFFSPVQLIIASPIDWIIHEFAQQLIRSGFLRLGGHVFTVESVNVYHPRKFTEQVKIRMLSPMTVYSTLQKGDGKKKTYYYTPFEKEFSEQISANLCKKYALLFKEVRSESIEIKPLFNHNRERIINFKGTVIKAWDGHYLLKGDPDLIQVSYETGLGSKNSQGFGMWEAIDDFHR